MAVISYSFPNILKIKFLNKKIQFVYSKKNSASNILLIEGTKNGKPGVKVLDPLYIYNNNNEYTNQLIKYLNNNL